MTAFLPPNLLQLFAPRPPIPYVPPVEKRKLPPYTGVSDYKTIFEDPKIVDYSQFKVFESKDERRRRISILRKYKRDRLIEEKMKSWNPNRKDPNLTEDAYKTIVVARLSHKTTEAQLKKEFEVYGPIAKVRMVTDSTGKPRGYAFIEYERERDMKAAYKQADGKKIDGRRVLVDVERGRTVPHWRPRRFGGGLGSTRVPQLPKYLRPPQPKPLVAPPPTRTRTEPRPSSTSARPSDRRDQRNNRDVRDSKDQKDGRGFEHRDPDRVDHRDRDRDRNAPPRDSYDRRR